VQVLGFFDVAAREGDRPIAALVGGASSSIGSALQHRVQYLITAKIISQLKKFNEHRRRKIRRRCPMTFMKAERMLLVSLQRTIPELNTFTAVRHRCCYVYTVTAFTDYTTLQCLCRPEWQPSPRPQLDTCNTLQCYFY